MLNRHSRLNLKSKVNSNQCSYLVNVFMCITDHKKRQANLKRRKNLVLRRTKRKETEVHTWALCDRRENVSWKFLAKSIELYYYSWRCYFIVVFGMHLLPEISLSLQEASKSQEYSDSCILDNNYPSVGIGTGVGVLPKKTVKNHIKTVMMRLVLYSSYEG